MLTLMDMIERVPSVIEAILENRKEATKEMMAYIAPRLQEIDEIVLVGSGTSNTCSQTSREVVEEVSGISTTAILPNVFLAKKAYNPNALYLFTSQSGTSTLTQEAQKKMKEAGNLVVAMSEANTTPLAKESGAHVDMGCGNEEFGQRTIGYCASILTQIMIGMEIGLARGYLSEEAYESYLADARRVPASHKAICEKTMKWFDDNKWKLMNVESFALYGAGPLWGVAQEGALKILEIAKRFLCVGYEMDDGMHGPTMGFTKKMVIIILNDGRNEGIANGLANYVKKEVGDCFVIGQNTIDARDLPFDAVGGVFRCLEYAPVVEILAHRLAADYGIVTKEWKLQDPLPEAKYFNTHDEE